MVLQRVDIIAIASFAVIFITNFEKITSLQCHTCKSSNQDDICWTSPKESALVNCDNLTSPSPTSSSPASSSPASSSIATTSPVPASSESIPQSSTPTTSPTLSPSVRTDASSNPTPASSVVSSSPPDVVAYQCVKLVYKDGESEVVDRKCIPKTNTSCDKEEAEHADLTICSVCDNEDGCNSSSNISFGLISLFVPFTLLFCMFKY